MDVGDVTTVQGERMMVTQEAPEDIKRFGEEG